MATTEERLRVLRNESQFLDEGGYRSPTQWRSARIFEDSPTGLKRGWSACEHADCLLLDFVPKESRHEAIPSRHIPLDESGETLDTLYSTGTNEEIQKTQREWLVKTIAELEKTSQAEIPRRQEKAG